VTQSNVDEGEARTPMSPEGDEAYTPYYTSCGSNY